MRQPAARGRKTKRPLFAVADEPEAAVGGASDRSRLPTARRDVLRDRSRSRDAADLTGRQFREPQRPVVGRCYADAPRARRRDPKFGDRARASNAPDLAGRRFAKPDVAVGAERDARGPACERRDPELFQRAVRRMKPPDLIAVRFREPKVALGVVGEFVCVAGRRAVVRQGTVGGDAPDLARGGVCKPWCSVGADRDALKVSLRGQREIVHSAGALYPHIFGRRTASPSPYREPSTARGTPPPSIERLNAREEFDGAVGPDADRARGS